MAEPAPGAGRGAETVGSARAEESSTQDRVYLDGSTLRRRRLAVTAPPQLLAAVRERRRRLPAATRSSDAPSLRVRRGLAWCNALLLIAALMSTIAIAILCIRAAVAGDWTEFLAYGPMNAAEGFAIFPSLIAVFPGFVVLVFSRMAGRRRGTKTGISAVIFGIAVLFLDYIRPLQGVELTLLIVGRLVTLVITVAALLPSNQDVAVPWTTFQRRCRRAYVLSSGFIVALAIGWFAIGTTIFPLNFDDMPTGPLTLAGLTIPATIGLSAAYVAGVRYVPLLVGGTVSGLGIGFTLAHNTELALAFGLPGLLVLGAFYWQLRRVAEHPSRDFWETRWHKWRWPLAMLPAVANATIAGLSHYMLYPALILTYIPGGALLLHAITELISDRFAGTVLRFRNKFPFLLHFD